MSEPQIRGPGPSNMRTQVWGFEARTVVSLLEVELSQIS